MTIDCPTTVIIPCAGKATRWRNHLGVPKHLIEIDGESLLQRTVRLAKQYGADDIFIIAKRDDDPNYHINGVTTLAANLSPAHFDVDKFRSSTNWWNTECGTRILFGDVYFTEDAMRQIMNPELDGWRWFCRMGKSTVTGHKYGEGFAAGFCARDIDKIMHAMDAVADLRRRDVLVRAAGWELARYMAGARNAELRRHIRYDSFVEVDDETDDFDTPGDYKTWMRNCRGEV